MKHLLRLAAVSLPLATTAALLPLGAAQAAGPSAPALPGVTVRGAQIPYLAGPETAGSDVEDAVGATPAAAAATATIKVTYHGFSSAAKASFQRAVNTWAKNVSSPVPITIDATWKPLATNVLGSAGPYTLYRDFPGAPQKNTFYAAALTNKLYGRDADPDHPDIVANFSSSFPNWWFGSTAAPSGKYDFQSVVTHELGHGLGFLGAGYVQGKLGTVRYADGAGKLSPSAYDQYTVNAAGKKLTSFADPSAALKTQLTSGSLWFDSPAVRSANGGQRARLYAPASFEPGSSYSHLDEATYRAGDKNSLMTPQLGMHESIRTPGPIVLAVFKTEGW